jgi:hypothetical protein
MIEKNDNEWMWTMANLAAAAGNKHKNSSGKQNKNPSPLIQHPLPDTTPESKQRAINHVMAFWKKEYSPPVANYGILSTNHYESLLLTAQPLVDDNGNEVKIRPRAYYYAQRGDMRVLHRLLIPKDTRQPSFTKQVLHVGNWIEEVALVFVQRLQEGKSSRRRAAEDCLLRKTFISSLH